VCIRLRKNFIKNKNINSNNGYINNDNQNNEYDLEEKIVLYQEKNTTLEKMLYSHIKYVVISFGKKKHIYDISETRRDDRSKKHWNILNQ